MFFQSEAACDRDEAVDGKTGGTANATGTGRYRQVVVLSGGAEVKRDVVGAGIPLSFEGTFERQTGEAHDGGLTADGECIIRGIPGCIFGESQPEGSVAELNSAIIVSGLSGGTDSDKSANVESLHAEQRQVAVRGFFDNHSGTSVDEVINQDRNGTAHVEHGICGCEIHQHIASRGADGLGDCFAQAVDADGGIAGGSQAVDPGNCDFTGGNKCIPAGIGVDDETQIATGETDSGVIGAHKAGDAGGCDFQSVSGAGDGEKAVQRGEGPGGGSDMTAEDRIQFILGEHDPDSGVVGEGDGFVNGATGGVDASGKISFQLNSVEPHEGRATTCIESIGNVAGGVAVEGGSQCRSGDLRTHIITGADQPIAVGSQKRFDIGSGHEDFERAVVHLFFEGKGAAESSEIVDAQVQCAAEAMHVVCSQKAEGDISAIRIGNIQIHRSSELIDFEGCES